ncbi:thiamine ABC transporter ATP-binding protein [Vibrio gazogenes]|uniref:Thiamine transport system ATP-binding protein n=1 Tax=Vibrio gazogenes DSM 21264 = NBRC 103151 TaxID=1123492 RepID=A0A1M5B973_VIBGA|nr:thiamine ABC transporter ATP-binding protein [Vibrio gazogenes]USP14091.1 thiamine ABC transporter ATP-binding protein [Vibrio gazogenes]SHF38712.1 thiamine transport system ATP-binding protein [Vibrio gazogenes DSM 21264] [Vibrio gazogenes DSM 21264 = NBRC 103151]SJN53602.1 Thiamine import ATP-binding protein ThiQ [Vibrio gazogenes]
MLTLDQVRYEYQQEWFDFSLSVSQGSIWALMGPSGAGKSTLLSLVAGFIVPKSGDIRVNDQSVLSLPPYERPFSMLFQEHNLFPHLSVRDNIGLGLHPGLKLTRQDWDKVVHAAHQVGIETLLDRRPAQLSGGQRQRVALARCFVQERSHWLLDEPFSALDPILRADMLALVRRLANERHISVLMVTHHVSDAKNMASHFAYIDENHIQVTGGIESLSESHSNASLNAFIRAGNG